MAKYDCTIPTSLSEVVSQPRLKRFIVLETLFNGRHDTQHNATQHNDNQHNDTQHNNK
jgi:hypothetical protein